MVYKNLDSVVDYLRSLGWNLDKEYNNHGIFELTSYPGNRMVYEPVPTMGPLFRGQPSIRNNCFSSLYRGNYDTVKHFLERMKLIDFEMLLHQHPMVQEELENGVYIDFVGLAQHYGIKTEVLDLTNSLIVAAFFATNRFSNGKYNPITDAKEKGVLYFIPPDFRYFENFTEDKELYPIGLQCFKRPGEQRGFSMSLKEGKDFNKIPGIFKYEFYHDKSISEKIYEALDYGDKIFPKDPIEEKVRDINEQHEFSLIVFEEAFIRFSAELKLGKEDLLTGLSKSGIAIVDEERNVKYSSNDLLILEKEKEKGTMFTNTTATTRLCYFPKLKEKNERN